jgi:hypothetical protein
MRYIKTYETYDTIISYADYKKYIITKSNHKNLPYDTPLLLFEVINIKEDKDMLYFIQHYHYKNNRVDKDSTIYSTKDRIYNFREKWDVLYTSDDLQECVKMLPVIYETNKYNI